MAASSFTRMKFPSPRDPAATAFWTGEAFVDGGNVERILCYDVGSSGWTEELTDLHESVGDESHYINVASREQAVASIVRWIKVPVPVILDVGCSSGYTLKLLR